MREAEKKVLKALLRNPQASDRKIAQLVDLSQPTVTRVRNLLKKKLVIRYELIPCLLKLNFEILAFSIMETSEMVTKDRGVIYAIADATRMFVMSAHRDYSDFATFARNHRIYSRLLVPTSSTPVKALSFKDIPLEPTRR